VWPAPDLIAEVSYPGVHVPFLQLGLNHFAMTNLRETTLAELVIHQSEAATVFEKYRLDFCCKGKRSLESACQSQGINVETIVQELEAYFENSTPGQASSFMEMPLDQLVDYLEGKHHRYIRQMVPIIAMHTAKTSGRHGRENENLVEIAALWTELAEDLTQHLSKEENILFPYIKQLALADRVVDRNLFPKKAFVAGPIKVMENEHDRIANIMAEINILSNQYKPPLIACTTCRLCFRELQEFEADLHKHVHLENHILFPKARQLEDKLIELRIKN